MILLQAIDAETTKFMRDKGIEADNYTAMKHYIEMSFLEELEVKPVEKKGISADDERKDEETCWEDQGTTYDYDNDISALNGG